MSALAFVLALLPLGSGPGASRAEASTPTAYMLDNGKIRFGGGGHTSTTYSTVDSFAASGMPQQPFYRNSAGSWFKLTFSSVQLSMTLGSGTGGANWTGSTVATGGNFDTGSLGLVSLQDRRVRAGGDWTTTRTEGGVAAGHGTLIVDGTATVNGAVLGIEHTVELGATDSFVRVTTRLSNGGATAVPNVHLWVGTRDDWVGNSDGPTKTRGNLVDGAFVQLSNTSESASALRIQSGSEGVLFYSTTPGTNAVHDWCCSFSNSYNRRPSDSAVTQTGDGSYAMYLPVGDLAAGASADIVWFYAAGAIADLATVASAVAAAAGTTDIKARTDTTATIEYAPSETGTVHRVVLAQGATTPTAEAIKAAAAAGTSFGASVAGTARTPIDLVTTGLTPTTSYVAYIVTEYPAGSDVFTAVSSVPFTTRPATPSGLTATLDGADLRIGFATGGGTITGFEYRVNGGAWTAASGTTSPLTIPAPAGGAAHTIELRAKNGAETGGASAPITVAIPALTLGDRTATGTVVSVTGHAAGDVHHLLVAAGSPAPTAAEVKAGAHVDAATAPVAAGTTPVTGGTAAPITLAGLTPTTAYDLYVVLEHEVDGADVLSLVRSLTFTTRAGAPTIASIAPTVRGLDVVLTAGSGTVTNYATAVSTDGGATWDAWVARSPAGTATSFTLGGLAAGDCYLLKVRALNGADEGMPATATSEVCVPVELPGTPTGLSVSARDGALRVSFTAPTATGDARGGLTGYEFRLDGGPWRSAGTTATTFEIVDLDNGQAYTVEVRAVNGFGAGGATAPATGTPGIPDATAVDLMLDNGRIRFGGGGHNATTFTTVRSIAESGMLRQPFYRAENGRWYKLTFSDAPLSMAIGTGTGGSNWTGSTVATGGNFDSGRTGLIALDGLAHSSTGWNETRLTGGISAGYGTLVVDGDVTVNGAALEVQHTFRLGRDDAFVEVTTRVTNPAATPVPNVNVWVGTRDDWVATSDAPTKTRGNLVAGTFTPITDATANASALRISSGGHGIFFHSTTPGANAVHAACCSFSNTYGRAPSGSPITTTGDGSYGLHLPAGDLAAGGSVELVWYYAAGSTADLVAAAREVAERPTPVSAVMPTGPVLRPVGTPTATPSSPVAVIGGSVVQVSATAAGTTRQVGRETISTASIVSAGTVALALDVSGAGQVRTSNGAAPQVSVVRDSVARTSGGGLLPGTEVRAWLPLNGGNARAVTTLAVGEDGTFSGALPFDGRADRQSDGRPLPIGMHVLQLVGVDATGQLAVIEQTVRIDQPSPAPELDRRAGAPPTLAPGSSIATNGGLPEPVRVVPVPDERQARVEGSGWTMAVDLPSADGRVSPVDGGALIELVADDFAQVSGDGFLPGTRADVWLFSTPTLLGSVVIGPDGRFSGQVEVDGELIDVGEHTLQLQGVGADGYVRAANLGVVVVPASEPEEPTAAVEDGPEPGLEVTPGPDAVVGVTSAADPLSDPRGPRVALLLILAVLVGGGVWFVSARRRDEEEGVPQPHQG